MRHFSGGLSCFIISIVVVIPHLTGAERPVPAPSYIRTNLLVLPRHESGATEKINSTREWKQRRKQIVAGMEEVMGPLPRGRKRPLNVQVIESVDRGTHIRKLITYQADETEPVPAYLLIPKSALAERRRIYPGVLCLHQTHKEGHKVVAGVVESANDAYGVELVERGFVCLAPAYPLLANYHPDLKRGGYESGTMKAIWNNIRGLDLLESLPYVKRGSFGSIGHSLGGHNGLYTAVFDERIKIVVSSCGFDSFVDYMKGDIKGWTSERYMPRLLNYQLERLPFDFYEVIGAIAPRTCVISAPVRDHNFRIDSVQRIVASANQVYRLYGREKSLVAYYPDVAHTFPVEIRQKAYEHLERVLK